MPAANVKDSGRGSWVLPLATMLLVLFIVMVTIAVWAGLHNPVVPFNAVDVAFGLLLFAFPIVGWFIAIRRPQNRLGWIFLAFPLLIAMSAASEELAYPMALEGADLATAALLIAGGWLSALGFWLFVGPALLLFPDGRFPGRRFRWALLGSGALALGLALISAVATDAVCIDRFFEASVPCLQSVGNPIGLARRAGLSRGAEALLLGLNVLTLGLSLTGMVVRYRRSNHEVRQQIKWVAWMAVVALLLAVVVYVGKDLLGLITGEWLDLLFTAVILFGLPASIGVAILRHRLYDIDRIISRTAAYTLLSAILATVFAASITLIQQLLPLQGQFSVVVSTLVVAVMFNPLRRRVQDAVDRRFHRSRYDARQVLDEFTTQLRDNVDLGQVPEMLLTVAQDTMQPTHLSLWVRDPAPRKRRDLD